MQNHNIKVELTLGHITVLIGFTIETNDDDLIEIHFVC